MKVSASQLGARCNRSTRALDVLETIIPNILRIQSCCRLKISQTKGVAQRHAFEAKMAAMNAAEAEF